MKKFVFYTILILGALVFLYPFLWMLAGTLKPEIEIPNLNVIPHHLTFQSYKNVFFKIPILRSFFNSVFVSVFVTSSVLFFGSMVGYSLARLNFRGKNLIYTITKYQICLTIMELKLTQANSKMVAQNFLCFLKETQLKSLLL